MIVRIEIHRSDDVYEYRVMADGDLLFGDAGFSSVVHCLVGAVEGLPPPGSSHQRPPCRPETHGSTGPPTPVGTLCRYFQPRAPASRSIAAFTAIA